MKYQGKEVPPYMTEMLDKQIEKEKEEAERRKESNDSSSESDDDYVAELLSHAESWATLPDLEDLGQESVAAPVSEPVASGSKSIRTNRQAKKGLISSVAASLLGSNPGAHKENDVDAQSTSSVISGTSSKGKGKGKRSNLKDDLEVMQARQDELFKALKRQSELLIHNTEKVKKLKTSLQKEKEERKTSLDKEKEERLIEEDAIAAAGNLIGGKRKPSEYVWIKRVWLERDGNPADNFVMSSELNRDPAYLHTMYNLGYMNSGNSPQLSEEMFLGGYYIRAWDMTSTGQNRLEDAEPSVVSGNYRLKVEFSQKLPRTLRMVCMTETPSLLSIDKKIKVK